MKYVLLLLFCALVFLVCFLVDKLLQKLFPKHELEKSKSVVRPPQKSATFGVLLVFIPLMALLFWMPEGGDALLTVCCVGAMIMGIIDNILTLMNVNPHATNIVKGAVILIAVLVDKKVKDLSAKAE